MIEDNIIIIDGGAYSDIKQALRDWIELYSEILVSGLKFELFKNGTTKYIIKADKHLDNEKFNFLINYLTYPKEIKYNIIVEGYTTIKDKHLFPADKWGKKIMLFIPDTDKDYDNVYGVTNDNDVVKIDFGGKISKSSIFKQFHELKINSSLLTNPETFKVEKTNTETPQYKKLLVKKLSKRFKIITIVIFGLLVLSYLTVQNLSTFLSINFAIEFAICGWLIWDYKMLQVNKYYLASLFLSFLIFIYGYFLGQKYSYVLNSGIVKIGTILPIFFLFLQRPMRFAFKKIYKREPIVDRPPPSFEDGLYFFILWLTTLLVPLFTMK